MRILICAAAGLVAVAGCDSYVELHNTTDRIWIMSKDGSTILRCIDTTPDDKPFAGHAKVFCKAAYMYGTVSEVEGAVKRQPRAVAPPPPAANPVEGEMK